jgi:hypothetical protein
VVAGVALRRDSDRARGGRVVAGAKRRLHLVEIGEHPLRDGEKRRARIGWHHTPILAPKERSAEPSLEIAELMAERGRCEVQSPRGAREGTGVDDRDDETKMTDFDVHGRSTAESPFEVCTAAFAHTT